jgi:acyl-CoA thioester hydrolase
VGETVEVWRGSVSAWECDSMGHLNVGFYVAKAMEGLAGLAAELGMPGAFAPRAETTLMLRGQHIRFLREARVDARLHIDAGVLEMGEDDARLLLLMRHHSGELAAAFQMQVAHATAQQGRAFPWPAWARARAERLMVEVPEGAAPRSVPLGPLQSDASMARARELGLARVGKGAVMPAHCDAFGRVGADFLMARMTASLAHLSGAISATLPARSGDGGVMLEYRYVYLDWPRAGAHFEVRSGFSAAEPRLRRFVHWILDPVSGRPWAAAEAVMAAFDTTTRKMVSLSDEEVAAWRAAVTPGLRL